MMSHHYELTQFIFNVKFDAWLLPTGLSCRPSDGPCTLVPPHPRPAGTIEAQPQVDLTEPQKTGKTGQTSHYNGLTKSSPKWVIL